MKFPQNWELYAVIILVCLMVNGMYALRGFEPAVVVGLSIGAAGVYLP